MKYQITVDLDLGKYDSTMRVSLMADGFTLGHDSVLPPIELMPLDDAFRYIHRKLDGILEDMRQRIVSKEPGK